MNTPPPFRGQTDRVPTFTDELQIEGTTRRFNVFTWEDRLVAHEERTGLWWGTLDAREERDARKFWRDCVGSERVARLLSVSRGFETTVKSNGARWVWQPQEFDVLITRSNDGLVRLQGAPRWHSFRGVAPKRFKISKPQAYRPAIWSPRFHTQFVRSSMKAMQSVFEDDLVATLPAPAWQFWEGGDAARPLRLVRAALSLGWSSGGASLPRFWQAVLTRRQKTPISLPFRLPKAMIEAPELVSQGQIAVWGRSYLSTTPQGVFSWKEKENESTRLFVEFPTTFESAHEQMEARLELRDWLIQFFPPGQVEAWFVD